MRPLVSYRLRQFYVQIRLLRGDVKRFFFIKSRPQLQSFLRREIVCLLLRESHAGSWFFLEKKLGYKM